MNLEQLNFHHLLYFWRVAKLGHLTQAAKQLNTSQSALSAQIKQLEERLGEPLFLREGRRLVLTETGHLVLSYAENIFGIGQEMLGRLQGQAQGITRLRVGSVSTLSRNYQENWIRPLLNDSSVMLTLESGSLETLLERLTQYQLDVVLANEAVPINAENPFYCRFLGRQTISLVGPATKWQAKSLKIPQDLNDKEIALPGPRHSVRAQFDALCLAIGVKPKLRAEVDDMAMLRLIARDSGWLTLLPAVVVQDELRSGTLVEVGQLDNLEERFYAITTTQRHRIELLEELISESIIDRHSPEDTGYNP